jgi:hypothetical protein
MLYSDSNNHNKTHSLSDTHSCTYAHCHSLSISLSFSFSLSHSHNTHKHRHHTTHRHKDTCSKYQMLLSVVCFQSSLLKVKTEIFRNVLRHSLSACVYCMQLPFQSNYHEPTNVITLKRQLHAENDCRNSA